MTESVLTVGLAVLAALVTALYVCSCVQVNRMRRERDTLYRNSLLSGLSGILAKMVVADGRIVNAETQVAERLFRCLQLEADELARCQAAFREACAGSLSCAFYAALFVPYSTNELRHLVYEAVWDISAADGDFSADEERLLHDLIEWLGLESDLYDRSLVARAHRFRTTSDAVTAVGERLNSALFTQGCKNILSGLSKKNPVESRFQSGS